MFRVLSCLATEHDWRLVLLAVVVCFLASFAAVNLFKRARAADGRLRTGWIVTTGAAGGCGIWATHFIAMLAYDPGIAVAYDIGLTALSFIIAAAGTGVGVAVAAGAPTRRGVALGGVVIGGAIAGMHYLGMWAFESSGHVTWSADLVLASIALGMVLGAAALMIAVRGDDIGTTLAAAALLTLAILAHHFTAMGAIAIVPDPTKAIHPLSLSPTTLAVAIAAITSTVLGVSLVGAVMDQRLAERNLQLDMALNNMSQGLLMFDAAGRLIVRNQRYVDMYRLPAEKVKPGCTLRDLLMLRVAAGTFDGDPDQYMAQRITERFDNTIVELPDGRAISITTRPMPGGGWVSTREDVTERRLAERALNEARAEAERAEREARAAHTRLFEALDAVPEGIALFDAEDRCVLWNRQFGELYAQASGIMAPGLSFEGMLRASLARGQFPDARGREEAWLEDRLARHAQPASDHEQHLPGDRWLRVQERRMADGGSIGVRIDITELKRREASFRLLFEGNPIPMWVYDLESLRFLAVNDAAVERYGYEREQFLSMSLLDIRSPEERDVAREAVAKRRDDQQGGRVWRHLKADRQEIEAEVYSRSLTYQGRAAVLVAAIDVSERRNAEKALDRTRAFLDTVIENMPMMVTVKEAKELRYVLINRAGEGMLGIPRDQVIGKRLHDLVPKEQADFLAARDREALASGASIDVGEHAIAATSSSARILMTRKLPIPGEGGKLEYLLSLSEDITERKHAQERIAHLAHCDALTDLPNRTAFNDHLASAVDRALTAGETFAVLWLDLDRFKEVNDVFGHAVGDALLREVAQRLRLASEGAFLARSGGDEFTLVSADGAQPATAAALAERLFAAVAEEIEVEGHALPVGLSVGVAVFPTDGGDAATLLANAEAALYRAKAEGRGSIRFFEADMDKRLRERRALQHDLRSAIARGELALHYQPQARINGGIVGFEALARWQHPVRGMVPPATFIPLAEESGLIVSMGEWILREACREAASWPQQLQIAVNLSPIQFRHGDLTALVHTVLLETGLAPGRLELEVTEGVLIDDFSRAVAILRRLKSLGVRIAMDDFGTGYSSLSYLQSFPFDKIKIDRAFITNVERNPHSAAIVRAVIGLGRGLHLPVVAEGVETQDQLDFLARESCDEVQGYLIGKPCPIEVYAELVGRPAMSRPKLVLVGGSG